MPRHRDERLALRLPGLYDRLVRRGMALPLGSPLRQRILMRIASRGFEAFSRGDAETVLLLFHPEVEIHFIGGEGIGLSAHYHGHEGVRAWMRDWRSQWGDYDEVLEELIDLGDSLITRSRINARGDRSGVQLTHIAGSHFHLTDGKVTRWDAYFDWSNLVAARTLGDATQHQRQDELGASSRPVT
jgi:ketosteroid isomerase-like protein